MLQGAYMYVCMHVCGVVSVMLQGACMYVCMHVCGGVSVMLLQF
jgi:hypothetical protein